MVDPVVQLLAQQSKSRLDEMKGDALRQIADLQHQVAWIDRAIAEKGVSVPEPREPTASAMTGTTAYRANRYLNGRRRRRASQKRDAVLAIMSKNPERSWTYAELHEALGTEGLPSTIESVRVLMRRMLQDEEVLRGGPNDGYVLPSAVEPPTEALPDDQMSAVGYGAESALASTDGSG